MNQFPHWGAINIRRRGTKYFRPGFVHPWAALNATARVIGSKPYQIIIRILLLCQQAKTYLCLSGPTLILTDFSFFQEFSLSGHSWHRLLKLFLTGSWAMITPLCSLSVFKIICPYTLNNTVKICIIFQN